MRTLVFEFRSFSVYILLGLLGQMEVFLFVIEGSGQLSFAVADYRP